MTEILKKCRPIVLLVLVLIMIAGSALAANIGVLMTGDTEYYQKIHDAFTDELSDVINKKGNSIVVMRPFPDPMSWVNSARKLIAIGSDLIVSYGSPGTLTLLKETDEIPVLFAGVYAPEKMKINVRNAAGISSNTSIGDVIASLDRIRKIDKLGIVFNKYENDSVYQAIEIKGLARQLEIESRLINIKNEINKDTLNNLDALLITSCSFCIKDINSIIESARSSGVATASLTWSVTGNAVILTVAANPEEQGRELARIVSRVMNGEKPSSIPVRQPLKIDIVVNRNEAKKIGLIVPDDVIKSATAVIGSEPKKD